MHSLKKYGHLVKTGGFINNQWIDHEKKFPVVNPYSQKQIASVSNLGIEDTIQAISAAKKAFNVWSAYTAAKRSKILKNWYDLQLKNAKDLAYILTMEQGKPLKEAMGEILYGAAFVEWFAEEAKRVYGDVIPGHMSDKRIVVIKQPIGVVAAITPWNFPSAMITRKVAPALAAGCTVVIKPSELTPLSALALAELSIEAGFPPGVLNIVPTTHASAVGKELCNNPIVKKLSFTGSTEVGKILLRQCADTVKKVSLELGGNAPFIVFDDADINEAVKGAIDSKFRNAGQTCICSNRIFVQSPVYDEFVGKLAREIEKLKIGSGLDNSVDVGPLIELDALTFVEKIVEDAVNKGAEIITGGRSSKDSFIYEPTLIKNVNSTMDLYSKEIFGPIAPVFKFETEEEVIALANNTEYGLASYFYGRDYARIWRVAEALEYGMVGINTGMISTPVAPFGGVKQSGFGKEGSKYGMDDYLNIKYMCWGGVS